MNLVRCPSCRHAVKVPTLDPREDRDLIAAHLQRRADAIDATRAKLRAARRDHDRDERLSEQAATLRQAAREVLADLHWLSAEPEHARLCTCPHVLDVVIDGGEATVRSKISRSCVLHGGQHATLRTSLGDGP